MLSRKHFRCLHVNVMKGSVVMLQKPLAISSAVQEMVGFLLTAKCTGTFSIQWESEVLFIVV